MKLPGKFWLAACVLLAINLVVYLSGLGGPEVLNWTSTLLPIACAAVGIAGVVSALRELKVWDGTKAAWLFIALGAALSAAGEITYMILDAVLGVDVEGMGSTIADAFWMAAYVPFMASLLILVNGYRKSGLPLGKVGRNLVALGFGFAVAAALAVWILAPILSDGETELVDKFVYVYYPIADFLVLIPAILLLLITLQFGRGMLAVPWACLAISFLAWGVADILYSYLGWNDLYGDGNMIDALWNVSYLLFGAAGLYQRAVLRSA